MAIAMAIVGTGCGETAPSTADRIFVSAMVPHHQLGVQLLDNAVSRVDDVRLRRLVFKMSSYHESELHDLEKRRDKWNVTDSTRFPGWVSPDDLDELDALSGPAYDLRWLDLMIAHHEGAVTVADAEDSEGTDALLRTLARRISVAQREEIVKMTEVRAAIAGAPQEG